MLAVDSQTLADLRDNKPYLPASNTWLFIAGLCSYYWINERRQNLIFCVFILSLCYNSLQKLKLKGESSMAEQVLVQFSIDKNLRQEVAQIYESLGLDLNTAFRMFLIRSKIERGLPFSAKFARTFRSWRLERLSRVEKSSGSCTRNASRRY